MSTSNKMWRDEAGVHLELREQMDEETDRALHVVFNEDEWAAMISCL